MRIGSKSGGPAFVIGSKPPGGGGGGAGGHDSFLAHTDTPGSYAGEAGKFLGVNALEDGVTTIEGRTVVTRIIPNTNANIFGEGSTNPADQGWEFGNNPTEYYADFASIPVPGQTGVNYLTLDDHRIYQWDGSNLFFRTSIEMHNPRIEAADVASFPAVGVVGEVYRTLVNPVNREYCWTGAEYQLTNIQFVAFAVDPDTGQRAMEVHDQSTSASDIGMKRPTTPAEWQFIHDNGFIFGTPKAKTSGFLERVNYDKCFAGAGVSGGNSPVGTQNQAIGFYLRTVSSGGELWTAVRVEGLNGGGAGDIVLNGANGKPAVRPGEFVSVYITLEGSTDPGAWGQGYIFANGIFIGNARPIVPNTSFFNDFIGVASGSGSGGSAAGTDKSTVWYEFGATIYEESGEFAVPPDRTDVDEAIIVFPNSIEKTWEVTLQPATNPGKMDKLTVLCLGSQSHIYIKNEIDDNGSYNSDWLFNGLRREHLHYEGPGEVTFNGTAPGRSIYNSLFAGAAINSRMDALEKVSNGEATLSHETPGPQLLPNGVDVILDFSVAVFPTSNADVLSYTPPGVFTQTERSNDIRGDVNVSISASSSNASIDTLVAAIELSVDEGTTWERVREQTVSITSTAPELFSLKSFIKTLAELPEVPVLARVVVTAAQATTTIQNAKFDMRGYFDRYAIAGQEA